MEASLFERNRAGHADFVQSWKYYNDGKSWLLNVSRKKKALFWLSVGDGWFRTTFYLSPKAEVAIMGSDLPEDLEAYARFLAIKLDNP